MFKRLFARMFPRVFKKVSFYYHARIKAQLWLLSNKPSGTLVYVGGNVGESFGKIYYKFTEAYCFEPNPKNYEILSQKFNRHKNVILENYACAENSGSSKFNLSNNGNDFASSSLANFTEARHVKSASSINVQTVNLEEYFKKKKIREIDCLITDTEGYDFTIIKSISSFLAAGKVKRLICEVVVNDKPNPFKDISNYEYLFDDLLLPTFEKKASGWTQLREGVFEEVPQNFFFKDVMYVLK